MPETLVQDPTEALRVELEELQTRRAERIEERDSRQAQLNDAPRAMAEGRGTPGETARLKAELSDLNDAVGFLDTQIADVQGQIAAQEAQTQRDQTLARMAELASTAESLHAELERTRRETVAAMRKSLQTLRRVRDELVQAQLQFDQLGETLVDGFSAPYRQTYSYGPPQPDIGAIQAVVAQVSRLTPSTEAILNEWRYLGGDYSPPGTYDRRYTKASPQLIDLGEVGKALDTEAGFPTASYRQG